MCERGEVLEVYCTVRGASIRCGLEAGDGEAVLGGDGGTSFQYYQGEKNNYTLIIPLSDWTIIYFASMLANSVISSILALRSSCTLNPCLQHPRLCFWSCTLVISLSLYLMYPYIPGLLFSTFVVCGILASLSIVTGVAVSCNEVIPDSGIQM